nr:carbohydrate kinase family protein [bacterium]
MYDIVAIIDGCTDLILGPNAIPEFGQVENWVDRYAVQMGGSASIFLSQAGRLGLKAAALGRIGNDAFGHLVTDTLKDSGVDTAELNVDNETVTGLSVILTKPDGDRAILTVGGTMTASNTSDLKPGWEKCARHLHIASPYLLTGFAGSWVDIARTFRAAGGTVSLDTNWDPSGKFEGLDELIANIDILMPNEQEACRLGGSDDVEQACLNLAKRVPLVACKCGGDGALAVKGTEVTRVKAFKVKVVDTVGAGDSFDGGFLFGYLNGWSMADCLTAGCVCGGGNVTAAGGVAGQPRLAALKERMGK